jgi:hypothetical protein
VGERRWSSRSNEQDLRRGSRGRALEQDLRRGSRGRALELGAQEVFALVDKARVVEFYQVDLFLGG